MKSIQLKHLFATSLLLFLTICSNAQVITLGTRSGSLGNNSLLATDGGNYRSQTISIYTAAEIYAAGGLPGNIEKLWWSKEGADYTAASTLEVYIKHVSISDWTGAGGNVLWTPQVTGATQVYSNTAWTIPNGTGWKEVSFSAPFAWNGTDNIAIFVNYVRPNISLSPAVLWAYGTTATTTNAARVGTASIVDLLRNTNRPLVKLELTNSIMNNAALSNAMPASICAGSHDINVLVSNNGKNVITDVTVEWEHDGVPQTPITLSGLNLDSVGGSGDRDTVVTLTNLFVNTGSAHRIKAWTSLPNNTADPVKMDDTTLFVLKPSLSGSFTIGGLTPDYATIAAAFAALDTFGVCGPVTFNLDADTFYERAVLKQIKGVSDINTITFAGAGKGLTVITNAATSSSVNWATITLNGSDYVTFRDMTIASTSLAAGVGIMLTNTADYNKFINLKIEMNPASTNNNTLGVLFTSDTTSFAGYGNNGNYNTFDSVEVNGGNYGIRFNGGSATFHIVGNVMTNCVLTNQNSYGTYNFYHRNFRFSGNTITGIRSNFSYGIHTDNVSNYIIENNFVSSIANGIALQNSNTNFYNPGFDTRISNNIITTNFISSGYSLVVSNSANLHILHNTVSSNGTTTYATAYFNNSSKLDFRNNIIINRNPVNSYALNIATTALFDSLDHNNYYSPGGILYESAATNYATLTAWQAAVPAFNTASLSVDPKFDLSGNLHLTASSPLMLGAYTGIGKDILGLSRLLNTPTMGAVERMVVPLNASIEKVISPSGIFCKGTYEIKVKLQNKGNAVINTVDVNWEIDGQSQTPITIGGPIDTLGSSAGADTSITLITTLFNAGEVKHLKVWTSNPNGIPDPVTEDDTLVVDIAASLSDTLTIGTSGAHYASIADAVTALKTYGICGPVVFEIDSGVYTDRVVIDQLPGVSATNTVTFKGAGKDSTFLTNGGTFGTVLLNGARYVTFRDMTITATDVTNAAAILISNASEYNNFINMNIRVDTTGTVTSVAGIAMSGSATSITADGNSGNYNTFDSLNVTGGYYGIVIKGPSSTSFVRANSVYNSTFTNQYYYGIHITYQYDYTVHHNHVSQIRNSISYALYPTYTSNYVISNNYLAANTGTYPYSTNKLLYNGTRSKIINNMVVAGSSQGILLITADSIDVFNNTVVNNGTASNTPISISSANGIDCRNNMMVNMNIASNAYAINLASSANMIALDNNIYYSYGGGLAFISASVNYTDLPSWRIAQPSFNAQSYNVAPVFVSATDLHLKHEGQILYGANTGITTDIDGTPRNNPPVIGAHERIPLSNSASVSRLLPEIFCPGTQSVQVRVLNAGNNIINSLQIEWELNGFAQTPISISTPIDTFGSIAGAEQIVTLGSVFFSASSPNIIRVKVSAPNGVTDPYAADDTLTASLRTGLSGPYSIGASGADYTTIGAAVNDLSRYGICGPVTFNISDGSYTEQLNIGSFPSQDPSHTVIFQSLNNDSTLVNINWPASATNENNYVVKLEKNRNIIFNKLTFERTGTGAYSTIFNLNATTGIQFLHNRFMAPLSTTSETDGSRTSVYSNDISREDSTIIYNNMFTQNANGVALHGNLNNQGRGTQVSGNIFAATYVNLWMKNQNNVKIDHNSFARSGSPAIDLFNISLENCDSAISISYNKLLQERGTGIRLLGCAGTSSAPVRVFNNIISGVQTGTTTLNCISIESNSSYKSEYVDVAHNTVLLKSASATTARIVNATGTATSRANNVRIVNNIFLNSGIGYVYYIQANSFVEPVINYNNIYTAGTSIGTWNSTTGITGNGVKNWISLTGMDSLSSNTTVTFDTDTNLLLSGASIADFNLATPLTTEVTDDINGTMRTGSFFLKGAHEPAQIAVSPSGDAGVWAIVSPATSLIAEGMQDIQLKIRNNGVTEIQSFYYSYSLNGIGGSIQNWGGALQPGKDTTLTFTGVNIPAGTVTMKAWTYDVNSTTMDIFPQNDTLTVQFTATAPLTGNFKIGAGETFLNLTAVADTLRKAAIGADLIFELTSTYNSATEAYPVRFSAPSGSPYSVTIRPAELVTSCITKGDAGSGTPLIDLDGVSNFIFDGRAGGTGSQSVWTIRNTRVATTVGSVIRLINGTSNSQLKYLTIEGQVSASSNGLVHFSTSTAPQGNSNNLLAYCVMSNRSDTTMAADLYQAVYSAGTAGNQNRNNTIRANRIFNFANYGINMDATGNGDNWTIDSNHFYNTRSTAPTTACYAIYLNTPATTGHIVSNNSIGGSAPNAAGATWKHNGNNTFVAIYSTVSGIDVYNNTITGIEQLNTGTSTVFRGIVHDRDGSSANIYDNRISNLKSSGRYTGSGDDGLFAMNGMLVRAAASANVYRNNVYSLELADTVATTNITQAGITITGPASAAVYGNTISRLTNKTKNNGRSLGIMVMTVPVNGSHRIYNNTVSFSSTAATTVAGIMHNASVMQQGDIDLQNNTVYVGGTSTGNSSTNSYGIYRQFATGFNMQNNVVYVERTGNGYAMFDNGSQTGLNADYNFYVSSSNLFNTTDFDAWKALGNDAAGYAATPAQLPSATIFTNAPTGDLSVNTASNLSWAFNGKGMANVNVATDINGNARSITAGVPSDLGAYEFTPSGASNEPVEVIATPTATPSSTVLSVYNRPVATINWRSGAVPTEVRLKYFSGVPAPGSAIGNNINSYYSIEATGGSGYVYDIALAYTPAETGNVAEADLSIAKRDNDLLPWYHLANSYVNTADRTVRDSMLTSFSLFTLTDHSNPLPVKLLSLNAAAAGKDVLVSWTTASELNASHFVVEASADGKKFSAVGKVNAKGTSSASTRYEFTHADAQKQMHAAVIYYRLISTDKDGSSQPSHTVTVNFGVQNAASVSAYPNPFTDEINLDVTAAQNAVAGIELFDMLGKQVAKQSFEVKEGANALRLSSLENLEKGIFFVRVSIPGQDVKVIKMIRQ